MRQPGFEEEFEWTTLFYDAFRCRESGGGLVFVGPPMFNLLAAFCQGQLASDNISTLVSHYFLRDRCCDVWIRKWDGGHVDLTFEFGSYRLALQPDANHLYDGKRVLYTLSRDNELTWIIDWARFHQANHGADALLIYDNASAQYRGEELEENLRAALPALEVNVVNWPYKYGPQGLSKYEGWDSDFCQVGAFQDARFRFLMRASSVLNCDIDELVVSATGQSIFEATESSANGCIMFGGSWISNASTREYVPGCEPRSSQLRHFDFRHLERSSACPMKWCIVPERSALHEQWATHATGKAASACRSDAFSYRHFRAITTNWKYHRYRPRRVDDAVEELDHLLDEAMTRAL